MSGAIFGRPVRSFAPGGTHLSVHLVPVHAGRLVVFDVDAREARGRWLPWDLLPWGGNPYVTAAELGDEWCDGAVTSLALVDILSFSLPPDGWELAIVFRAELSAFPVGDPARTPAPVEAARLQAVGRFEPVDLARWLSAGEAPAVAPRHGLVF